MFPYVRMATVGARSGYQHLNMAGISASQGTNSDATRLIDYLFHVVRSDVIIRNQSISPTMHGSDHYVYYSGVELR
jgi:hypothetical protein